MTRLLDTTSDLPADPVDAAQLVSGSPVTGARTLAELAGTEIGVWEMTPGVATDVETDEVFVVLAGSATVLFEDGEEIELAPGAVVRLREGEHTTWTVRETLRKVYIA